MAPIRTVRSPLGSLSHRGLWCQQQWTRLIRFVAVETGEVHLGQPIDPKLDGAYLLAERLA